MLEQRVLTNERLPKEQLSVSSIVDDVAAIPKNTLDHVYEAKARVLNHAVCLQTTISGTRMILMGV